MVFQLLSGIQEIKLQGCEQRKRWQWEDTQADLFDVNMQSLSLSQSQEAYVSTSSRIFLLQS